MLVRFGHCTVQSNRSPSHHSADLEGNSSFGYENIQAAETVDEWSDKGPVVTLIQLGTGFNCR